MKFIHCSWDLIDPGDFTPRIPQNRAMGAYEDDTIPRICVTKHVEDALRAMPGTADVILGMQKQDLPLVIHAYYLTQDPTLVIHPRKCLVPDVDITKELWMLEKPIRVNRVDYLIEHPLILPVIDQCGSKRNALLGCRIRQTKFQNNTENLLKSFGMDNAKDASSKIREIASFRQMITDEELLGMIRKRLGGKQL